MGQTTFWTVVSAITGMGLLISGIIWDEVQEIRQEMAGMPMYVEQRVQKSNMELASSIKELGVTFSTEMRALREALIEKGVITAQ